MSQIRLEQVSKRYPGVDEVALEQLNIEFAAGQLTVLVGPSGCGKSTTLRIVAGLEKATSGRVLIGDRDVTDVAPSERDIAMVFQSYALYPHMSVHDNLAFALRIRKESESEIKKRVHEVAAFLEISGYLDRRPKNLSGGQRQRVAIGRAVIRKPKVFLFDEPLSNLDAKLRGEMRREIARVHNESRDTTSLYVTHDQVEAMTLAHKIVVLRDGVVQQIGTPLEVYDKPANRFVAGFFGTPAMNFLEAEAQMDGDTTRIQGKGFSLALERRTDAAAVALGVRPEALSLAPRDGAFEISGRVRTRELLGSEAVLYTATEAGELTIRVDAHTTTGPGDSVTMYVVPTAAHLFSASSGLRL